jgi:prepilin-type N-terminal cleavage/methylation domain-containing protein
MTTPRTVRRGLFTLARRPARRAFSLVEMLIAISISGAVLAATTVAFDAMFKVYDTATDSASNHVVARIAVNRMLGMIRTGTDFGPFPNDVLNDDANPLQADYFEFASRLDPDTGAIEEITRVEFRFEGEAALNRTWGPNDAPPAFADANNGARGELWLVLIDLTSGDEREFLMLSDVRAAVFSLHYDIGPRLVKGTVDITFEPTLTTQAEVTWTPATPESVRLVASAMPRRSIRRE